MSQGSSFFRLLNPFSYGKNREDEQEEEEDTGEDEDEDEDEDEGEDEDGDGDEDEDEDEEEGDGEDEGEDEEEEQEGEEEDEGKEDVDKNDEDGDDGEDVGDKEKENEQRKKEKKRKNLHKGKRPMYGNFETQINRVTCEKEQFMQDREGWLAQLLQSKEEELSIATRRALETEDENKDLRQTLNELVEKHEDQTSEIREYNKQLRQLREALREAEENHARHEQHIRKAERSNAELREVTKLQKDQVEDWNEAQQALEETINRREVMITQLRECLNHVGVEAGRFKERLLQLEREGAEWQENAHRLTQALQRENQNLRTQIERGQVVGDDVEDGYQEIAETGQIVLAGNDQPVVVGTLYEEVRGLEPLSQREENLLAVVPIEETLENIEKIPDAQYLEPQDLPDAPDLQEPPQPEDPPYDPNPQGAQQPPQPPPQDPQVPHQHHQHPQEQHIRHSQLPTIPINVGFARFAAPPSPERIPRTSAAFMGWRDPPGKQSSGPGLNQNHRPRKRTCRPRGKRRRDDSHLSEQPTKRRRSGFLECFGPSKYYPYEPGDEDDLATMLDLMDLDGESKYVARTTDSEATVSYEPNPSKSLFERKPTKLQGPTYLSKKPRGSTSLKTKQTRSWASDPRKWTTITSPEVLSTWYESVRRSLGDFSLDLSLDSSQPQQPEPDFEPFVELPSPEWTLADDRPRHQGNGLEGTILDPNKWKTWKKRLAITAIFVLLLSRRGGGTSRQPPQPNTPVPIVPTVSARQPPHPMPTIDPSLWFDGFETTDLRRVSVMDYEIAKWTDIDVSVLG